MGFSSNEQVRSSQVTNPTKKYIILYIVLKPRQQFFWNWKLFRSFPDAAFDYTALCCFEEGNIAGMANDPNWNNSALIDCYTRAYDPSNGIYI